MAKTIEKRVADTVLQSPQKIKAGSKTYEVKSITTGTLILVSERISQMPSIGMDQNSMFVEVLATAKDCRALGDIAATLILGAKTLHKWGGEWRKRRLAQRLLDSLTPQELNVFVGQALNGTQIAFFFALSTSLIEVNLLRKTKTTASGPSSQES